jgi:hypothetical protein
LVKSSGTSVDFSSCFVASNSDISNITTVCSFAIPDKAIVRYNESERCAHLMGAVLDAMVQNRSVKEEWVQQ